MVTYLHVYGRKQHCRRVPCGRDYVPLYLALQPTYIWCWHAHCSAYTRGVYQETYVRMPSDRTVRFQCKWRMNTTTHSYSIYPVSNILHSTKTRNQSTMIITQQKFHALSLKAVTDWGDRQPLSVYIQHCSGSSLAVVTGSTNQLWARFAFWKQDWQQTLGERSSRPPQNSLWRRS